jgi:hypothetical protein
MLVLEDGGVGGGICVSVGCLAGFFVQVLYLKEVFKKRRRRKRWMGLWFYIIL